MKISIVTPSYNQGKYIEEAIQSVLNQNYDNFEHIIIDACSTDNTIEILKKYPHLIWVSEPDEGQSDAINKGFKKATGDIIGWLNADDLYLPNTFNRAIQVLKNDKIDAVYADYQFINSKGVITKTMKTMKPSKWISLFNCYIPSTTFFFKRDVVDNNICIDKEFDISMDKEFFAHILYSDYTIAKIDALFAHFRWHDSNKSLNTKEVKEKVSKEGLIIFNRYTNSKIPITRINAKIYRQIALCVNNIRKVKAKLA